jgi:hypothetical protein
MLIGTAGELPPPPTQQTIFVEDLTETELAEAVSLQSSSFLIPHAHSLRINIKIIGPIPGWIGKLGKHLLLELHRPSSSGHTRITNQPDQVRKPL